MQSLYLTSTSPTTAPASASAAGVPVLTLAAGEHVSPSLTVSHSQPTAICLSDLIRDPVIAIILKVRVQLLFALLGVILIIAPLFIKSAMAICVALAFLGGIYWFIAYTAYGNRFVNFLTGIALRGFLAFTGNDMRKLVVSVAWIKKHLREIPLAKLFIDVVGGVIAFFINPLPSVAVYTIALSTLNAIVCPPHFKKAGSYILLLVLVLWTLCTQERITRDVMLILVPVIGTTILNLALAQIIQMKNQILSAFFWELINVLCKQECGVSLWEITRECRVKLIGFITCLGSVVPDFALQIAGKFGITADEIQCKPTSCDRGSNGYSDDGDGESDDESDADSDNDKSGIESSLLTLIEYLKDLSNPNSDKTIKSPLYKAIVDFMNTPSSHEAQLITCKFMNAIKSFNFSSDFKMFKKIVAPVEMNNWVLLAFTFLFVLLKAYALFPALKPGVLFLWVLAFYGAVYAVAMLVIYLITEEDGSKQVKLKIRKVTRKTWRHTVCRRFKYFMKLFPAFGVVRESYSIHNFLHVCNKNTFAVKKGVVNVYSLVMYHVMKVPQFRALLSPYSESKPDDVSLSWSEIGHNGAEISKAYRYMLEIIRAYSQFKKNSASSNHRT